jgi:hypothetical protein
MRVPLVSTAVLASALALGCADQEFPTATADPPPPPPSLGAERFIHIDAFVLGGDPSNPLALQVGFDPGATPQEICADPVGQGLNGVGQIVFTPSGGALTHGSGRDVNLVVYEFGGGPVTDVCQLIGAPVVGTGTGDFTYNILALSNGGFVAHITAHGTLDLATGGQARLFATARVVVRPDGTLQFDEEQVRLTPL